MEELSSLKLLSKWQRLICSPVQTKPEVSSPVRCYDAKHHEWSWMFGCWHSAVFRDIIPKRYTPIFLFVEDRINSESACLEKRRFDSRYSSSHTTIGCSTPDAFEPLLYSTEASWNISDFFLPSFWSCWAQWRLNFLLLSHSCHFPAWVSFEDLIDGFLVHNLSPLWSMTTF